MIIHEYPDGGLDRQGKVCVCAIFGLIICQVTTGVALIMYDENVITCQNLKR